MPKDRLLTMGLLSKYPKKSWILKHFLDPNDRRYYSDAEKMHMAALWFTPELPKSWIKHQFQTYSDRNPDHLMQYVNVQAYRNKEKYGHLGQQNILFIGQPEVERYYLRRPPQLKAYHPSWAVPIFNDHVKSGMTIADIARKYGCPYLGVYRAMQKSIFESHQKNPNPTGGYRGSG